MNNNCINLEKKTRRKNKETKYREIYFKCTLIDEEIALSQCKNCDDRHYPPIKKKEPIKANKLLNKISKKNTIRKHTNIPKSVKLKVHERDKGKCIFCSKLVTWHYANSHFIKRSQLGLGIEENIFCACQECHSKFDDSVDREEMLTVAEIYLKSKYSNWDKDKLKYKKV